MGRMYSCPLIGTSVSAVQDLIELQAPDGNSIVVHEVRLSQEDIAVTEFFGLKFHRGTATGTGGTAGVEVALGGAGEPVADGLVELHNTTQSVETSILYTFRWNVLTEFLWLPTPEMRPTLVASGASFFIVELETTPSGATNMFGSITWEEFG